MRDRERNQVDLILSHELKQMRRIMDERVELALRKQNAHGRLKSGSTIHIAVREMGEIAETFLKDIVSKVHAVARSLAAFEALSAGIAGELNACEALFARVVRMAVGTPGAPENATVERAARELYDGMRATLDAKLAIARFGFEESAADAYLTQDGWAEIHVTDRALA
jgi:hypothetical protein